MDQQYIAGLIADFAIFAVIGGIEQLTPIKNVWTKAGFDVFRHALFKSKRLESL